jgi:dihydroorotate dehydrogenase
MKINIPDIDIYPLLRPLLFKLDAEQAHMLTLTCLKKGLVPPMNQTPIPGLKTTVCGLNFDNPIGLAAGFDKQAEVMGELFKFGFGSIEVGSITPEPQPGNPQPRLFRFEDYGAVINRFGFNSDGFDVCRRRLIAYRDASVREQRLVGINIGKNKESENPVGDYVKGVKAFAPYASYLVINVSSPNTPGLRDMQDKDALTDLLAQTKAERDAGAEKPPLFVKISPDQNHHQLEEMAEVFLNSGIDGIIVGNTTLQRPEVLPIYLCQEQGGLSGRPLFDLSTQVLSQMYKFTGGKISLIGCGGVSNGEEAYIKIRAGASLIQLYTALIYHGPFLVKRIKRELAALLERDGFSSVTAAVGIDHA